jgi:prepilin-type N-terminal cleavage/methylation domain-containing protein
MKNQKGFTIVEVLIAMAVGVVILGAVYAAVSSGLKTTTGIRGKITATQDARQALELMSLEAQMASFNPTYASANDMWLNATCSAASTTPTYRGIQVATGTTLTIQEDINRNGYIRDAAGNMDANEVITYTYDSANQRITRTASSGTTCGTAQAFLGDTASSSNPRTVRVINTADVPVFRYFDARGNEVTTAANIPTITRIDITLWVETEDVAADKKERRKMLYSNSIIPRNHVISY